MIPSTDTVRRALEETLSELAAGVPPGDALRGPLWEDLLAALADSRDEPPCDTAGGSDRGDDVGALEGHSLGRFRIGPLLGSGGMGEVYRAQDELLEREVAVKTLRRDRFLSREARERFLREARCLSQLDHPHVCRLFDVLREGDTEAIVLELIPGTSLRRRLADGPRLEREERLRIVAAVASGLAAAHRTGVVHRDVKPGNVLLTPAGEVKLIDFGIARPEDSGIPATLADRTGEERPGAKPWETRRGVTLGTIAYMSPEQARGEVLTTASDVYSLGVLLQELLTDRPVHRGESAAEVLDAVRIGRTEPVAADLAPPLRNLLRDMLRPDPEARPGAGEVCRRLERILGEPERRRRRRREGLAVAAALLAVVGSAFAAFRWSRPEPLFVSGEVPRVAVLPFSNATGDASLDWVSTGLAELVADNLGATEGVDTVPFPDVAEFAPETLAATTGESSWPDAEPVKDLGRSVGATVVVAVRVEGSRDTGFRLTYRPYREGVESRERRVEAPEVLAAANELSARLSRRLAPEALVSDLQERLSEQPTANLVYAIGLDRFRNQRFPAAEPFFRAALELDPRFLEAELRLAQTVSGRSHWEESDRLARRALERARKEDRPAVAAAALETLAAGQYFRGDREAAAALGKEALAAAEESGEPELVASTSATLARTSLRFVDPARGRELLERAGEIYRRTGNRRRESRIHQALGAFAAEAGDDEGAEAHFRRGLELAREMGAVGVQVLALDSLGITAYERQEYQAAEELFLESGRLIDEFGDRRMAISNAVNLVNVYQDMGRLEDAEVAFAAGEELCAEVDAAHACALLAWNRAEFLLGRGQSDAMIGALLDRSAAFWGEDDPDILFLRSLEALLGGETERSRELLAQATRGVPEERAAQFREEVRRVTGKASQDSGAPE